MLAIASTLVSAEVTIPPLSTTEVSSNEGFEEIVLSSFQDNNSSIYIDGIAPTYKEFAYVPETMQGRKVDPDRSKMRYYKKA